MIDYSVEAAKIFDKYAVFYAEKYGDVSLYKDSLQLFSNALPDKGSVLELGCGPGNVTKFVLDLRPDLSILATDLAPSMLQLAKQANPSIQTEILDCRHIAQLTAQYQGILCAFCLPYLSKAEALQFISDATTLLQKDGLLYISTMEDLNSNSRIQKGSQGDEVFMSYHEGSYLVDALQAHGFELIHEDRISYPAPDGSMTVDLILIAKRVG